MRRPHRILLVLRPPQRPRTECLIFSLLFLMGVAAGHVVGGFITEAQRCDLYGYLFSYAQSAAFRRTVPLAGVLFSYFRGPILFFCIGLAPCGTWLVPLCMAGQGFALAFCLRCLMAVLGRGGVLLALAALGVRCLFVLPCIFFLAGRSWAAADRLRSGRSARTNKKSRVLDLYPIFICGIALLIGCVAEISLVPQLLTRVLGHIF